MLNGKWQFAFWVAIGDDFDVTKWMFADFPADIGGLPPDVAAGLAPLARDLEAALPQALSFKQNAGKRVGTYNLAKCRGITDAADAVLGDWLGIADVWEDVELLYVQTVKTNFDKKWTAESA